MHDVVLVHDYLTQRGGAERVLLDLARAFPNAPIITSLYDPSATFPEFADREVRPLASNRVASLRRDHRRALPVLAPVFSATTVEAKVAVCSSSGWAHGVRVRGGHKLVYCHTPARWLYQPDRYLEDVGRFRTAAVRALAPPLRRWDRHAAASVTQFAANSSVVQQRIREEYGRGSTLLPPAPAIDESGPRAPVAGLESGFVLCVSRLLPYKNVDVVLDAARRLPETTFVVVGDGPERERLVAARGDNVTFVPRVDDDQLRWLYASAALLVSASYEDFGLTPIEAASFGTPSALLRWGGFLDTLVEGRTGVFFDEPSGPALAGAIREVLLRSWDAGSIAAHAATFGRERFVHDVREWVRTCCENPQRDPGGHQDG